uniref:Immunoglobulin superfamily, member 5a n=1 Tax=Gasterosteus aculeatus aculeatus TaxID=481459 RepID=G3Q9V1_GASAC|nr:immunoglobulin superfamily member 5 isoform X2 [Gasterosteus aculeatus aculeatus]
MAVPRKCRANLTHICLLLCAAGAVLGEFQLEPLNLTVLQGSDARFNATVKGPWRVMTWNVGGLMVLNILITGDIASSSEQFSAGFCSNDRSCVEFTIRNVTRSVDASPVICSMLGDHGSKTAQLYIQESGTVSVRGQNVTVVQQDQQVEFQCVTSAWFPMSTVTWSQNGQAVNSNLYNTTGMADGDTFNSTSVLTFQAVRNTTVECLATVSSLTSPQLSSVFLVVVPKPRDWTVLIAVVVSIGGFALLVLLILGIIFCYKRSKEKQPNYQDEMRRARTQSQMSGGDAAEQRQGHENAGYLPEGVPPSRLTDSGFSQENGSKVSEVADDVNQARNGYSGAHVTVGESGVRKHRHVTIV